MAHASIDKSARLRRLLMLLSTGQEFTTLEIIQQAQICAVNTCVHELRQNGVKVNCRCTGQGDTRLFHYRIPAIAFIDR